MINLQDTLKDLALNIIIPFAFYTVAKRYFAATELVALIFSSLYPILDTLYEGLKDRTLNIISATVLLGTSTAIVGILFGGTPKLLLIRESFFTGLLGIACFISLATPRPLMFYFAREFVAGKDPEKRKNFTKSLQFKLARDLFKLITVVWGVAYVGEFVLRVFIIYMFPTPVVLVISPVILTAITIMTLFWTTRYAKIRQQQIREIIHRDDKQIHPENETAEK
jgi:hypothetical protein